MLTQRASDDQRLSWRQLAMPVGILEVRQPLSPSRGLIERSCELPTCSIDEWPPRIPSHHLRRHRVATTVTATSWSHTRPQACPALT